MRDGGKREVEAISPLIGSIRLVAGSGCCRLWCMIHHRLLAVISPLFMPIASAAPPLDSESLALFRVVEDKDGYVNARTGPSPTAKVDRRVSSGCAVAVSDAANGWFHLEDETGAGRPLFIHGSRLGAVGDWKQVPCVISTAKKTATVHSGGFKAVVTHVPFNAASHDIKLPPPGSNARLTIDGHRVIGTDGTLPDASLNLDVLLDGSPVAVPPDATRDLYQPNLARPEDLVLLTSGDPAKQALVFLWASDGAGGYFVIWSFLNGKYVGRALFTSI